MNLLYKLATQSLLLKKISIAILLSSFLVGATGCAELLDGLNIVNPG